MTTTEAPTLMDHAIAAGGTLWERAGRSRVYLNRPQLAALDAPATLTTCKVWVDVQGVHAKAGRTGTIPAAGSLAVIEAALRATPADGTEVGQQRTDSPTPTYRETRQRRVEHLQHAAERHAAAADELAVQADQMLDAIPFGQPILVGHHSEGRDRRYRARISDKFGRAVAEDHAADDAASRAAEIERQMSSSIYDDDPDALERLTLKLAVLEDRRTRIARYNKSARAALKADPASRHGDLAILSTSDVDPHAERYGRSLADDISRGWGVRNGGVLPSYLASNLGGVITATRRRIARLSR